MTSKCRLAIGFELPAVPQAIPFPTGFSADSAIDLIGFTRWVLEPLFTHHEQGSATLFCRELGLDTAEGPAALWQWKHDILWLSGAGSGHADGLVGWRDYPVPRDFGRYAGLRDERAACRRALSR